VGLEHREVCAGLVGDQALEAVALVIGEGELGAGVRALAATYEAGATGPLGQELDRVRELADRRAGARLAVLVGRLMPSGFLGREDGGADRLGDLKAEREADAGL